jgi:hypothetical protein
MTPTLDSLLDLTADALLRGDLAALAGLTEAIEAQADTPPRDRAAAERLRAKADRNARLLQAAGRGVRAARARLGDIATGPVLTTYDARGHRESIAAVDPAAARRV